MNTDTPTFERRPLCAAAPTPWRLGRVEIRPKISHREEVVARVELVHAERGRVTEIAGGEGGVEAGFAAIGRILGIAARLERLSVNAVPSDASEGSCCRTSACVTVRRGGYSASGSAVSPDMLSACLCAYLQALLAVQQLAAGQPPA
jgi:2-isopropylmalate synthase